MASKREVELELALWQTRQQTMQANVNLLNAQAQLLQLQSVEIEGNVKRLAADLEAMTPKAVPEEPAPKAVPEEPAPQVAEAA